MSGLFPNASIQKSFLCHPVMSLLFSPVAARLKLPLKRKNYGRNQDSFLVFSVFLEAISRQMTRAGSHHPGTSMQEARCLRWALSAVHISKTHSTPKEYDSRSTTLQQESKQPGIITNLKLFLPGDLHLRSEDLR
ncbi:uncharacterized protein PRD47_011531 [Ara ararauna]